MWTLKKLEKFKLTIKNIFDTLSLLLLNKSSQARKAIRKTTITIKQLLPQAYASKYIRFSISELITIQGGLATSS